MTDEAASTGTWAIVGKLATVVGLIIGIIGIWSWYRSPSSELIATVEIGRVTVPPNVANMYSNVNSLLTSEELTKIVGDSVAKTRPSEQKILAVELESKIRKNLDFNPFERIDRYGGYWSVEVENTGDVSLKDVMLRIPGMDIAQVINEDGKQSIDETGPAISLGEVVPGQKVSITAWQESSPVTLYGTRNITVNHAGGKGSVEILEAPGWFRDKVMNLILFLPLLPVLFFVGTELFHFFSRKKPK